MEKSPKQPLSSPSARASTAPSDCNRRRRRHQHYHHRHLPRKEGYDKRIYDGATANKDYYESPTMVDSTRQRGLSFSTMGSNNPGTTEATGAVARLDGIISSLLRKRGRFSIQYDDEDLEEEEEEVHVIRRVATADSCLGKGESMDDMNWFKHRDEALTYNKSLDTS
eukprot:6215887-Ditylum_brightwellii.AAC.1